MGDHSGNGFAPHSDQELGGPLLLSKNGHFPAAMSSIPESNFNGGDDTVSPTPELSDIVIPSRPADPLATGLKSLLDPTIKQTTEKLLQVHRSQQELNAELTRLISRELHRKLGLGSMTDMAQNFSIISTPQIPQP